MEWLAMAARLGILAPLQQTLTRLVYAPMPSTCQVAVFDALQMILGILRAAVWMCYHVQSPLLSQIAARKDAVAVRRA